jgi:hypothetical protein
VHGGAVVVVVASGEVLAGTRLLVAAAHCFAGLWIDQVQSSAGMADYAFVPLAVLRFIIVHPVLHAKTKRNQCYEYGFREGPRSSVGATNSRDPAATTIFAKSSRPDGRTSLFVESCSILIFASLRHP